MIRVILVDLCILTLGDPRLSELDRETQSLILTVITGSLRPEGRVLVRMLKVNGEDGFTGVFTYLITLSIH